VRIELSAIRKEADEYIFRIGVLGGDFDSSSVDSGFSADMMKTNLHEQVGNRLSFVVFFFHEQYFAAGIHILELKLKI
jgi:hypothetical protein